MKAQLSNYIIEWISYLSNRNAIVTTYLERNAHWLACLKYLLVFIHSIEFPSCVKTSFCLSWWSNTEGGLKPQKMRHL